MLLQCACASIVAKKLLVDDKITANGRYVSWVLYTTSPPGFKKWVGRPTHGGALLPERKVVLDIKS